MTLTQNQLGTLLSISLLLLLSLSIFLMALPTIYKKQLEAQGAGGNYGL